MLKRAVTLAVTVGGMMLMPVPAPALAQLSPAAAPSAAALADIPPRYLALYTGAARTCPGLPWQVLAAIGSIESDNGRSAAADVHEPTGDGGPEGPMQFEPATFAAYAVRAHRGVPVSPYDPADAIYTAARMLCAAGASGGSESDLYRAIYAYDHAGWYVSEVLNLAARYSGPAVRPKPSAHPAPPRPTLPSPSESPTPGVSPAASSAPAMPSTAATAPTPAASVTPTAPATSELNPSPGPSATTGPPTLPPSPMPPPSAR